MNSRRARTLRRRTGGRLTSSRHWRLITPRNLDYAIERLRNKLEYTTVGFQLLPSKFTLGELQMVYEAILGKTLDKRNFRRKISDPGS